MNESIKQLAMLTLGFDVGSSSVKAAVADIELGKVLATALWPANELPINAPYPGWAEQDPEMWWKSLVQASRMVLQKSGVSGDQIQAVGLSYQMHGLVLLDRNDRLLRPAIIWCDSRAVAVGEELADKTGRAYCFDHLLNLPGNFTASKLAWVRQNEPGLFANTDKMMLPGDYLSFRLTGMKTTTLAGLSEGILWDFPGHKPATRVLESIGVSPELIPERVPVFGDQGTLTSEAAKTLGLNPGTPLTYRAGDQPNNALSLNVLEPGEVAATAGTSGVIYGVSGSYHTDRSSRVNLFAHVNHSPENPRVGVLLCINGTGIQYAWLRRNLAPGKEYHELNDLAATVPAGAGGLRIYPFGNGAERIFGNRNPGAAMQNIDFNRHTPAHIFRAAQEGIAFSLVYGLEILKELEIAPTVIRAGEANLFLSPLFSQTFSSVADVDVEIRNSDGAAGAALGAALGAGLAGKEELFANLKTVKTYHPGKDEQLEEAYEQWKEGLTLWTENQNP